MLPFTIILFFFLKYFSTVVDNSIYINAFFFFNKYILQFSKTKKSYIYKKKNSVQCSKNVWKKKQNLVTIFGSD